MAFGMSTIGTALMVKESGIWNVLIPTINYPDLGGDPELVDITTLFDKVRRNVKGVQDAGSFAFDALYTPENYARCKELEDDGEIELSVWFGGTGEGESYVPTGSDGKFDFKGQLSCYVTGNGVNEARGLRISVAVSSEITFSYDGANSISLNKSAMSLTVGSTGVITATTVPADATVAWTSLNTSVASVSGGTVTAVAAGRTTIIADIDVDGITYSAACSVTVVGAAG